MLGGVTNNPTYSGLDLNMMEEDSEQDALMRLKSLLNRAKEFDEKNVKFEEKKTVTHEEKFIPHVIEPAFGIGRVLYCVFEHCFKMRENDVNRTYFDFPPTVAPLKTSILPLMNNPEMNKKT